MNKKPLILLSDGPKSIVNERWQKILEKEYVLRGDSQLSYKMVKNMLSQNNYILIKEIVNSAKNLMEINQINKLTQWIKEFESRIEKKDSNKMYKYVSEKLKENNFSGISIEMILNKIEFNLMNKNILRANKKVRVIKF